MDDCIYNGTNIDDMLCFTDFFLKEKGGYVGWTNIYAYINDKLVRTDKKNGNGIYFHFNLKDTFKLAVYRAKLRAIK